jgi:phosphocarrier protein
MCTDANALRRPVIVKTSHGLHLGPCTVVARLAMQFQSSIVLSKAGKQADAKRVLELSTLGAQPGEELELEITGDDAPAAMQQFLELFDRDFFPDAAGTADSAPAPG